jgi:DNA (cytosine-5)-methyltransferase 1
MSTVLAEPRQIALITKARRALAEARSIDEVKDIRDQAEAIRLYLRQRDESLEAQNEAAEIKIRAERRAGELLREMPKHPPGPDRSHDVTDLPSRLCDLGIGKMQSSRWQRIASLPEETFQSHIEETRAAGKELTTSGVLAKVREINRPTLAAEPTWTIVDAITRIDTATWNVLKRSPVEFQGPIVRKLRYLADAIESECGVVSAESNGHTIVSLNGYCPTQADPDPLPLRYGSVCSGIEAATVAWHPLGWQPAWFAEIAEFPSAVLAYRHPEVPNLGDFTRIECEPGSIDLLVGGTPCQSFSVAGLRKGMDDDRGNLALEYLRLARRARPRWLIWENVPGVLSSHDGRDFDSFVAGLAELGYGWAFRVLDARHWGVAQRRRRLFLVAHSGGLWQRAAAVLFERSCLSPTGREVIEDGESFALRSDSTPRNDRRERANGNGRLNSNGHPTVYGWNGDESPKLGRNVTPTLRAQQGGEGIGIAIPSLGIVRRLTALEWERLQAFPENYTRIPFRGKTADECPEKPRLSAVGNSMAVSCMAWIGARIQMVDSIALIHGATS